MSNPRVALVVPVFPKLSETFVVRHAVGLLDRGWDLHIVCGSFDAAAWSGHAALRDRPGVRRRVHATPPSRPRWRAALAAGPRLALLALGTPRAVALYRRRQPSWRRLASDAPLVALAPDLVHFEFGSLAPERIDLGVALPARTVVSFRGFDLNFVGLDDPDHYADVWSRADGLHLLGEDLWRRARGRGCPDDAVHALIPPAVDASRFEPPDRSGRRDPIRIVSVGRLEWKKGHDDMLRAVRRLVDRGIDVRYSVVGDGSQRPAIAFARHQLGLEEQVELLGARPHDAIHGLLADADIFLHLSVSEGFGNAVLEAQAMALPAVVSDADGLADNVADGVTGFVVPRRDPDAAADRLAELAIDRDQRLAMGRAGRRRVEAEFRPEAEIDAFEALYRRVLA